MVRAIRLQLYSGRSPGDVHAGRYLPEYGKLPASPVVRLAERSDYWFHHMAWKLRSLSGFVPHCSACVSAQRQFASTVTLPSTRMAW
jgi:hypothetical protein